SEDDRVMLHKLCEEVKTIADEVEAAPRTIADAASMRRLLSADLGFHMLLLRVSGNRRMMKIVADSRLLTRIFGTPRQEHDLAVLRETYRFHREILDAVESGDGETARRLMAEHIAASRREALEHYDRTHSGGDTRTIPLGLPEDLLEDLDRIERGPSTPPARKPRKSTAS
ncbi:MAG TPA: FCD domain-containing protein, partial [Roseimicrobium sp.]|nr:FCD domain-containing protein [Roseimicrobium sp.]